jgi:hypothetical protein
MNERLWSLIAWMVTRPAIRAWLIRQAQKRPYLHIGDYMHRWWLVPPSRFLPFAIRIHHIKREDADPFLHDHPFDWRTIILDGWYREENVFGVFKTRCEGDTRAASAETLHRIDEVSEGGVWTLFIIGRRRNEWGFMVGDPSRKVHWRQYESPNQREYKAQP